jgi:hypothetical protein
MQEDIREYILENYTVEEIQEKLSDRDDWEMELNDELFTADSVTGNGSGSYTFNSWKSREYVLDNFDLLKEAATEFCCLDTLGEKLVDEEWEYCDVTIRCYLLNQELYSVLEDLEEEYGVLVPF